MRGPTGVYWGELPCLARAGAFELVRSRGWEPAVARFQVLASEVQSWLLRRAPDRFAGLGIEAQERVRGGAVPSVLQALQAVLPGRFEPLAEVPARADLYVFEAGPEPAQLRVSDMWLVEVRAAVPGQDPILELVLADVRRWWGQYGEVTWEWNRRVGTAPWVRLPFPVSAAEAARGAAELIGFAVGAGQPVYDPRSLLPGPGGGPARPARTSEIVQACLDALPGAPWLHPEGARLLDHVEGLEVRAWGASAREVAAGILDRLDLLPCYSLDGTFTAVRRGAGVGGLAVLGEAEGGMGPGNDRPETEAWAGIVRERRLGARWLSEVPDELLLVGPPPVYSVAIDGLVPIVTLVWSDPEGLAHQRTWDVTGDLLDRIEADLAGEEPVGRAEPAEPAVTSTQEAVEQVSTPVPWSGARAPEGWRLLQLALGRWDPAWPQLPDELRQQIQEQIFRRFRVPDRWRWLLPILPRAERDSRGRRLAPVLEAWRYRAVTVKVAQDAGQQDERSILEQQLQAVEGFLAVARRARDERRVLDLGEVWQLLASPALRPAVDRLRDIIAPNLTGDDHAGSALVSALYVILNAGVPTGASVLPALVWSQIDADERERLKTYLPVLANGIDSALGVEGAGQFLIETAFGDPGPFVAAAEREKLDKGIEEAEKVRADLLRQIEPERELREELDRARAAAAQAAASGEINPAKVRRILELEAKLEDMLATQAQHQARRKRPLTRHYHRNETRRPVGMRIVDAQEGVVEIPAGMHGPAPACGWLANPLVAVAAESYLVPLPPRLLCGSWLLSDPWRPESTLGALPTEQDRTIESGGARLPPALAGPSSDPDGLIWVGLRNLAGNPKLAPLVADMGSIVPTRRDSPAGLRLRFSRADPQSGEAQIGPYPVRVPVPDLQELVDLQGRSNRDELLARAREIAAGLLAPSEQVPCGTVLLAGPRPVNPDGIVSAVRWRMTEGGNVDTEVSADDDREPFAGLVREGRRRAAGEPLVFGQDPRGATRIQAPDEGPVRLAQGQAGSEHAGGCHG